MLRGKLKSLGDKINAKFEADKIIANASKKGKTKVGKNIKKVKKNEKKKKK